jgi:hypothetical protein
MARPTRTLQALLALAASLAAALAWTRMGPRPADGDAVVEPARSVAKHAEPAASAASGAFAAVAAASAAPAPAASAASGLAALAHQRGIPTSGGNAFGTLSWLPPPPPPAPVVTAPPPPPPPPTAPPLPFTLVGMVEQGVPKPQAFLAKGDNLLVVSVGDVIENSTYRVESLSATAVVLTYLPMNKQQTLISSGAAP